MNVEQLIPKLLKKCHWIKSITKIGPDKYLVRHNEGSGQYDDVETARGLYKLDKIFSSKNRQNTALNSIIKHNSKRMNRAATRDAIKSKKFDRIPQQKPMKEEDGWYYD